MQPLLVQENHRLFTQEMLETGETLGFIKWERWMR